MDKGQLRAIMKFASKDETRPVLTGLYIKQQEEFTTYVATNGEVLVEVKRKNEGKHLSESSIIVPPQKIDKATSVAGLHDSIKFGYSTITVDDVEVHYDGINGEYPDYSHIMAKTSTVAEQPSLDSKYIKIVAELFNAFNVSPIIRISGKMQPVFFEKNYIDSSLKITAVIMPLKV